MKASDLFLLMGKCFDLKNKEMPNLCQFSFCEGFRSAIKALPMAHQTCQSCKYLKNDEFDIFCMHDDINLNDFNNESELFQTFCCNRYEKKD